MFKKFLPLLFVFVFNFWLWKILSFNIALGLVIVLASIFLWLEIQENKKFYFYTLIVLFGLLLFFQWKTSFKTSLIYRNDNEKVIQQEWLKAYPPIYIKIAGKTIWIPIAHWLEQRKESMVFYKIEENFSEVIDPNLFFFANHPRERVGVIEFEKFPYILLPIFIVGLFSIKKKNLKDLLLGLSPIVLISFIGNSNPIGPFALFPLFAAVISIGLAPIFSKKQFLIPFIAVFILVFIQIFAYAKY